MGDGCRSRTHQAPRPCSSADPFDGRLDERNHRVWLGHVDGVTGSGFDHFGIGSLGHEALRIRGIIRSSVATRYQLGLVRHAGSVTAPARASTPQGTWESAMNAARSGLTSAANDAANLSLSRNRKPSCGGRMGGTGAPGGGSAMRVFTDSPRSGANAAMYTSAATFGWVPASVMTAPPYECPTSTAWSACWSSARLVTATSSASESRRVLHDGHCVAGLPQDLVDGLPAGAVDETAMDEDDAGHGASSQIGCRIGSAPDLRGPESRFGCHRPNDEPNRRLRGALTPHYPARAAPLTKRLAQGVPAGDGLAQRPVVAPSFAATRGPMPPTALALPNTCS